MSTKTYMDFDVLKLKRLKKEYAQAVERELYLFTFDGALLLTAYAKYLIMYLEDRLEDKA